MNDNRLSMFDLKAFFQEINGIVTQELDRLIPESGTGPRTLRDAIRWSLLGGGKRFRPALVFSVGRALGAADRELLRTAAAVEMLHTYSLIHDDLPSMDDDDLRRGRETCHIKYGESTAILAGDALQALAFQTIAEDEALHRDARIELVAGLARSAAQMVCGQQLDLESEGKDLDLAEVEDIHLNKTGALIAFSANAGAIIAGAGEGVREAVNEYASGLGLLFQITDDLLDVTQSTEELGKTAGKDKAVGKATYPSVLGIDATREKIAEIHDRTIAALRELNSDKSILEAIADFLVTRGS